MNTMPHDTPRPAAGSSTQALIAELVDGLQPVRPMRFRSGMAAAFVALGVTVASVGLIFGFRPDVIAGHLDPVFVLAAGLFLLLGIASSATVVVMSQPRVGSDHAGWLWAAAMAAMLPVAAVIVGLAQGAGAWQASMPGHGPSCLITGSGLALVTFAALVWWLRRGAPTSPERAGLVAGTAAGSFGIFAVSFYCDINHIMHVGLWHAGAVVLSAAIGRLAVPHLIRW